MIAAMVSRQIKLARGNKENESQENAIWSKGNDLTHHFKSVLIWLQVCLQLIANMPQHHTSCLNKTVISYVENAILLIIVLVFNSTKRSNIKYKNVGCDFSVIICCYAPPPLWSVFAGLLTPTIWGHNLLAVWQTHLASGIHKLN